MFRVLQNQTKLSVRGNWGISFGPFNSTTQRRWKKPADTAQTRLENRTRDAKLDKLASQLRNLGVALQLFDIMSKRRRPYVSLQVMSRWVNLVGIDIGMGEFIGKYPHLFEVFTHPVRRNLCCRLTEDFLSLINEERQVLSGTELENVKRIKKVLMMSRSGVIHLHALRLVRRALGLPEDFQKSIILKNPDEFTVIDVETIGLVKRDETLCIAELEKWREKEYKEKWLSEFETKYAFPIDFPTGFRIERGFKEKLSNWQRMPYVKPYEHGFIRPRTSGAIERFEKRVVAILHELLSLTVEKMIEVERFVHFKKHLGLLVNIRELLLKHPGIFYISTKGGSQTVFLREAYDRGCLIEPNDVYIVRRKMLDLMLLGCRNTGSLKSDEIVDVKKSMASSNSSKVDDSKDGDWVVRLMESSCD
ncbi:hypothetical protein V2J09_019672 [Rumex salicifolius]